VIALLSAKDPAYVHEAAKRGVFAYIVEDGPEELQSAIDITLQRFAEYHSLQGAFGRRATIEQAKGILMASHAVDAERAFEMRATIPSTTGTRSSISPRRSSTVTCCCYRPLRAERPPRGHPPSCRCRLNKEVAPSVISFRPWRHSDRRRESPRGA
jgi:ANTAR domain